MLTETEIVNMTASMHQTLKTHEFYKQNLESMKAWTLNKYKESTSAEEKAKLEDALASIETSFQENDNALNEFKHKAYELGFGTVYQTAQALMHFPI
jgi:molecular chaperone DnaK (HSP70)